MQQIDVKILDRDYKLAVEEADRPRLVDAARVVDEKMRSIRDAGRVNGSAAVGA
jgi:cell division protein ZapA